MPEKRKILYRSEDDKHIAGVLGGLGEYLNVDSNVLRILYILFTLVSYFWLGILLYFIMALIIPVKPKPKRKRKK